MAGGGRMQSEVHIPKTHRKVVVQHRSDMLLEEQIKNVKNAQDGLKKSLAAVASARTEHDLEFHQGQVSELKQRLDGMMVVLKIVHKVNIELVYARMDLQKALKDGSNINISLARKRIGWLEDRVDNLLGKRRQRSHHGGFKSGDRAGNNDFDDFEGLSDMLGSDSPKRMMSGTTARTKDQDASCSFQSGTRETSAAYVNPEEVDSSQVSEQSSQLLKKKRNVGDIFRMHHDVAEPSKEESDNTPSDTSKDDDQEESRESTEESTEESETEETDDDTELPEVRKSGILRRERTRSEKSRASRVTIKSPIDDPECQEEPSMLKEEIQEKADREIERLDRMVEEVASDWENEHGNFDFNEYAHLLLQLDPLSYHQMGLAVPGTFVDIVRRPVDLPWLPKRNASDMTDIHKLALNALSADMNKMFDKVRDASLLSVRPTETGNFQGPSLATELTKASMPIRTADTLTRETPVLNIVDKPSLTKHGLTRPDSNATINFPPLDKDRLGSSLSNRLVYYPNPLPYPDNLPVPRTDRSIVYPKKSSEFSRSVPGEIPAPERICDQRNLYNETKFTSSLFRPKVSKKEIVPSDFKKKEETPEPEKKKKTMKTAMLMAKSMIKFQAVVKWKDMKPKTGALVHSGLKWERVKSIVHHSLVSPHADERKDAARHLGALECGDTMVLYALRERLRHDDNERVIFEATKSLIILGCWDEEVIAKIVHYLMEGNRDVKENMLKAIIIGKNVQYIDKRIPSFQELSRVLSLLCISDDPADNISFHAAVSLGKMCVVDENAKNKLKTVLESAVDPHQKAETLEIMVRQMNLHDPTVIEAVLCQLQRSPVWKHRRAAARQLIHLGRRMVMANGNPEKVFQILERRLWDDPNKIVRSEVAKVLAALGLFAEACEKVEKKLEDPNEEVRVEAVVSVGTLGMKNERTIRALLEMIELDTSPFVRLMIIRTFGDLNTQDKRVLRALKVRVGGDERMSMEASRVLDLVTKGASNNTGNKTRRASKASKGLLSKGNTQVAV